MRRGTNNIFSLKANERTIFDNVELKEHVVLHFKKVFGCCRRKRFKFIDCPCPINADVVLLKIDFIEDEINCNLESRCR